MRPTCSSPLFTDPISGRPPRRRLLVAVAAFTVTVLVAACGTPQATSVGPVDLEVPAGWDSAGPPEPTEDLIAEARWRPSDDRSGTLQVLIGCGDADADQLRHAVSQAYHLTGDAEATAVEVAGLRSAQRIDWELRADPDGEAGTFRMAGLYGAGSGGLVVVEVGAPEADFDAALAGTVLDSVEVDADELSERCADHS